MNRLVLIALACFATPALADDARLTGMAEAVLASEWADPVEVDEYLFNPLRFDAAGTGIMPDNSLLADVTRIFGGEPHTEEIFDNLPVIWHCYDTPKGRTTFASLRTIPGNETMEAGPVVSVIIEEMNPPAAIGCAPSDTAIGADPGGEIPTLGATRSEIEARFNVGTNGDNLAITTHYLAGDYEPWTERKVIYYRLENDVVTGVAYKQTTDLAFGGFMKQAVTGRFAGTGEFESRPAPRVGLIQSQGLNIELEVTPMQAVIDAFGGRINETGEAGGHVVWICYAASDATIWFYSDGEMGDGKVTGLAAERGFPSPAWGCATAPFSLGYMQFDAPGLGATEAELAEAFQPLEPDDEFRLGFTSESPHPTKPGFMIVQDNVYRFGGDDKVDAVAILQITGD
jgi:hypothetical protein